MEIKVFTARVAGRPIELRYVCPDSGKRKRVSSGTHDPDEAEKERAKLEAKLLLGIEPEPRRRVLGPDMSWEDFRDEYSRLKVCTFRSENAKVAAEVRLDVIERMAKPNRLKSMADGSHLAKLQAELLAKGLSPHTVKSYMTTLLAALSWAYSMGWLADRARFKVLSTERLAILKGRPLTTAEFKRMLAATDAVCGETAAGWKYLLRGLWESGLRLSEAMVLAWDLDGQIQPQRTRSGAVLLKIPANRQKNHKDQYVPTTPAFANLLDETPIDERSNWVFNPPKLRGTGRFVDIKQVGRIITRIGEEAGVCVNSDGKAASAHDLRRSFGQRMADAGMAPRDLQAIMRHASYTTTERYYLTANAGDQAERIARLLGCDRKSGHRSKSRRRVKSS